MLYLLMIGGMVLFMRNATDDPGRNVTPALGTDSGRQAVFFAFSLCGAGYLGIID
jgi:hypothetical protein